MEIFAKRLKELRTQEKISMKKLAIKIELTDAAISNYENNINEPTISNLKKIALFFDVSSDYLIGLTDEIN